MSSSSALAAPPQAQQAAEVARLGRLVEVYPYRARRLLLVAVGLAVLVVVIGLVVIRSLRGGDTAVWALLVVGATAMYGLWYAASAFRDAVANRRRNRQICLFDGGFVVVDAGRAEAWPWREIDSVQQHVVQYRSEYGGDRGTERRWTVVRRDGRSIVLHNIDIDAADQLGETIARMTS